MLDVHNIDNRIDAIEAAARHRFEALGKILAQQERVNQNQRRANEEMMALINTQQEVITKLQARLSKLEWEIYLTQQGGVL